MLLFVSIATCGLGLGYSETWAQDGTPGVIVNSEEAVKVDTRLFTPYRASLSDHSPGALKFGGYYNPGIKMTRQRYHYDDDSASKSEIFVEIGQHPVDYPYVVHDLFSTIKELIMLPEPKDKMSIEEQRKALQSLIWFPRYQPAGDSKAHLICVATPRGGGGASGTVMWYNKEKEQYTTIIIRYENLKGIPIVVIDELLAKYPSNMTESRERFLSLEDDDIKKWINVLNANRADRKEMVFAAWRLERYAGHDFGVRQLANSGQNASSMKEELTETLHRIIKWSKERS